MRKLGEIHDESDIYQPVSELDLEFVESKLRFRFPVDYRRFAQNPEIEATRRLPTLLWFVEDLWVGLLEVNDFLRGSEHEPYPDDLIAFATHGCGDYFCLHRNSGKIVTIDPDRTIEENLASTDLVFESFDQWIDKYSKPTNTSSEQGEGPGSLRGTLA